jgi:PAS domain S-box-containing protein
LPQAKLEEREKVIKAILDNSKDVIITFDHSGHFNDFNLKAEQTFGIASHSEFLNEMKSLAFKAPHSESGVLLQEHRNILKINGEHFPAHLTLVRQCSKDNFFYILYIKDLTDEIETKALIDASRAKSAQASKMASLGEMAGGIAHEINNPLSVILMNSEIISDMLLEEDINREFLHKTTGLITLTAKRISKIIQGLKKFSRDDSNLSLEKVEVSTVVEDSTALCKEKLTKKHISLIVEPVPNWILLCRPVGLSQVILNLVNNACDAIEEYPEKWIKIFFREDEHGYCIFVQDSGSGIPKEIQEKLMEPFFTTKAVGKGTGLGLSISKGIVEAMEGNLCYCEVDSHTTFKISFNKLEAA